LSPYFKHLEPNRELLSLMKYHPSNAI
jgi:hypothetical protein